MDQKRTYLTSLCVMLLGSVAVFCQTGCKDERRHATASALKLPEARPPLPADAAPADVARAFLESVRDAQHSRERGFGSAEQKQAYESAMATLRSLAASRAIYDEVRASRSMTVPKDISEDAAVTLALESWVSLVAYYVDGFLFDTISISTPKPDDTSLATIRLQAERPEDASRLRKLETEASVNTTSQAAETTPGSASIAALRAQGIALRPPMNVPVRAGITIALVHNADGWRVAALQAGPPIMSAPGVTATTPQPAVTTAPSAPPAAAP
jgi:hypothetical protein